MTVLVAADEIDSAELVVRLLRRAGHEVALAASHDEVMARLEPLRPACLVVDLYGLGSSLRLIDAVRSHADPELATVPVVLLTAASGTESVSEQVGVARTLVRPFPAAALVDAVTSFSRQ